MIRQRERKLICVRPFFNFKQSDAKLALFRYMIYKTEITDKIAIANLMKYLHLKVY